LDRIDVFSGYSPENVRWATAAMQANNRRRNVRIAVDGESLTMAEAARKIGKHQDTLYRRRINGRDVLAEKDLRLRNIQGVFPDGKVLRFESVAAAAKFVSGSKTAINNCLNGRSRTSRGVAWSYE
jgi:hypothetical protein